jgi:hypothetical protein
MTGRSAFVATIDTLGDFSVSFCRLPVEDGILVDGNERYSQAENEADADSDFIAVLDEEDSPELRAELTGIVTRRFEAAREFVARYARLKGRKVGIEPTEPNFTQLPN